MATYRETLDKFERRHVVQNLNEALLPTVLDVIKER